MPSIWYGTMILRELKFMTLAIIFPSVNKLDFRFSVLET